MTVHIGVDLGGTKLLVEALTHEGVAVASQQVASPRDDYDATIIAISELVGVIEDELNLKAPLGIGMPGSLVPSTGLVQNANSTWLNGRDFGKDISKALGRGVRLANDANCFALSEACDGAGADAASVFGVIMGTGVGGGLVVRDGNDNSIINGPRSIGGEWGHCGLPYPEPSELLDAQVCWCGRTGCLETWISGPSLVSHYNGSGETVSRVEEIVSRAAAGETAAIDALSAHASRTARGLAMVVNIFDPEVIVLGGGLSNLDHLYEQLPILMKDSIFSDEPIVDIRRPRFGATSGVRGAARLWPF